MTLPDWKAEDYFVDFDNIYFSGPIVNAPLEMKTGWIMRYLHEVIFPDAIKAVVSGGELSGLLLGFSIVDYLAGYFAGKSSQAKDFMAFLNRYFPDQYKPYAKEIYHHLRSGLIHNLTLQNPWIQSNTPFTIERQSNNHLLTINGKVVFSIYHFIEDTRRAEIMYLYDLIMKSNENKDLVKNFHRRFNKQDGATSMMAKTD
ncbi:MAG: hypothetical protein HUU11_05775 [Anaerolineales bacterium]|nr:hypothetical protein [Anaerolineales bacterium]